MGKKIIIKEDYMFKYGERKKFKTFMLSPFCKAVLKKIADREIVSRTEVLEAWARTFGVRELNGQQTK
jgi:2-phospho-L-lactate guanylyltransferase (CobY/MobA/RfbA family)